MDFIILFSPLFLYLIYSFLSVSHRVSIFQIASNYDRDKVKEYIRKNKFLKNLLTVLFDKSTILDAYGFHFLKGEHDANKGNKIPTSILIIILRVIFFLFFICSVGFFFFFSLPVSSNPILIYVLSIAKFVTMVMLMRSIFSYLMNLILWFRYKMGVIRFAREDFKMNNQDSNQKFDAWDLWFNDKAKHEKYLETFTYIDAQARSPERVSFNTKAMDLIKYISSDRSGTEKIIYFCIFTVSVANSFTLVDSYLDPVLLNSDQELSKKEILPKVLFRLFYLTLISFPIMCIFLGIVWILAKLFLLVSVNGLSAFIESSPKNERSLFVKQFIKLITMVIQKNYSSFDPSSLKVNWGKDFKEELLHKVYIPSGLVFIYGYLFTAIFVIWFESKPGRYSKDRDQIRNEEIEEGFQMSGSDVIDRVRRYSLLCKSFIIATGFFVGCMIVFKSCVKKAPLNHITLGQDSNNMIFNLSMGAISLLIISVLMALLFY